MAILQFFELSVWIDTETNKIASPVPIEEFLGASCTLLEKQDADEWKIMDIEKVFVHEFNPSEMREGKKIKNTDLEYIKESKPESDLSHKKVSAIVFNREENTVYSTKSWSHGPGGFETRWLRDLQIQEYSRIYPYSGFLNTVGKNHNYHRDGDLNYTNPVEMKLEIFEKTGYEEVNNWELANKVIAETKRISLIELGKIDLYLQEEVLRRFGEAPVGKEFFDFVCDKREKHHGKRREHTVLRATPFNGSFITNMRGLFYELNAERYCPKEKVFTRSEQIWIAKKIAKVIRFHDPYKNGSPKRKTGRSKRETEGVKRSSPLENMKSAIFKWFKT